jgi:GNAT superfamily N-acetyltransferase
MAITFKDASAADAESLVAIRIRAMRESLERIGRFDPQRARDRFLSSYDPQSARVLFKDGNIVGFFAVKSINNGLLLDHLYIEPVHQGQGIGAIVLAHVFAEADAKKLPLKVGALRDSKSNNFYLRHGFVKTAEEEWDIYYIRQPQEKNHNQQ